MRIIIACLLLFAATKPALTQTLNKLAIISFLNAKAQEANGAVRIFSESSRTLIENASFSASETGVVIQLKLTGNGKESTTFWREFNPAEIELVGIVEVEKKSPVSQIKITLKEPTQKLITQSKTDGQVTTYEDLVYFNFLQIDKENAEKIRQAFWDLKKLYAAKPDLPIAALSDKIIPYKSFWILGEAGTSNTYRVDKVYADGCTLKLFYKQETVTKIADATKYRLVEIPLSAIGSISINRKKSKANCIILHAAKKEGFDVFSYSKEKQIEVYKNKTTIKEFPLLIDVTYPDNYKEVTELLKQLVKNCGGKKIKI